MSSSDSSSENNLNKRRKKGKSKDYQFEKIKKARVHNEEYVSWKGKTVKAKEHGFHCKREGTGPSVARMGFLDLAPKSQDYTFLGERRIKAGFESKPSSEWCFSKQSFYLDGKRFY
ncbi:hypothetical protein J6590_086377 [Homalodisca vitripennis]|nr:hypothetical protein J6590_086377 [Homalodisca vitripennis]